MSERETQGRRVVVWMYLAAVGVAGVFGYVLGSIVYGNGGPAGPLADGPGAQYGAVGPVTFELTGPNLALFGVLSVGVLLGVGLVAIEYVSRRTDAS
ncbi:DUF7520 family protein [Halobacterium yunchengense]|uniref:DUF7520 family protein n=1 Tax=Halobacterium yunchengense TaxID=3108497 RepID=UPI00300A22C0